MAKPFCARWVRETLAPLKQRRPCEVPVQAATSQSLHVEPKRSQLIPTGPSAVYRQCLSMVASISRATAAATLLPKPRLRRSSPTKAITSNLQNFPAFKIFLSSASNASLPQLPIKINTWPMAQLRLTALPRACAMLSITTMHTFAPSFRRPAGRQMHCPRASGSSPHAKPSRS